MAKPTKPRNNSPFDWFFGHKDMLTTLNYLVHNKGKPVEISDIEKHLGFSEFYLSKNILKHLTVCKIIKKTASGYAFTTSQAAKSFLKLNEELERIRSELPVSQLEIQENGKMQ